MKEAAHISKRKNENVDKTKYFYGLSFLVHYSIVLTLPERYPKKERISLRLRNYLEVHQNICSNFFSLSGQTGGVQKVKGGH